MKLTLVYIIVFLTLSNSIFSQKTEFEMKFGIGQNLNSERSFSSFVGVSHKINFDFLQFEFGIKLLQNKINSSHTSNFEFPQQIGEYFLITKLISEEILIMEYSSFPTGIAFRAKNNLKAGIGIEPMLQIQQTRKDNQKLVNIFDEIVDTETTYEKIDFTPYNLEIYYYLNIPISKRIHFLIIYSHGIIEIQENQYIGGYVGRRQNSLTTKRASIGLSYSILN